MTTANTSAEKTPSHGNFRFPDPPERKPDDMTSFNQLTATGNVHNLIQHLGNPDTTLVTGEHYLSLRPTRNLAGVRYPDLLVAFDVNPAAYRTSNAYIISEQGKPPDFVLEIASPRTGRVDIGAKRDDYAGLLIPEYWRFDETETGRWHGTRLAGDRLVGGVYVPIPIDEPEDGALQGYSAVLNLYLRWENGQLGWIDPAIDRHIATLEDERTRADAEREARLQAEARVQELEAEIRRLRDTSS